MSQFVKKNKYVSFVVRKKFIGAISIIIILAIVGILGYLLPLGMESVVDRIISSLEFWTSTSTDSIWKIEFIAVVIYILAVSVALVNSGFYILRREIHWEESIVLADRFSLIVMMTVVIAVIASRTIIISDDVAFPKNVIGAKYWNCEWDKCTNKSLSSEYVLDSVDINTIIIKNIGTFDIQLTATIQRPKTGTTIGEVYSSKEMEKYKKANVLRLLEQAKLDATKKITSIVESLKVDGFTPTGDFSGELPDGFIWTAALH